MNDEFDSQASNKNNSEIEQKSQVQDVSSERSHASDVILKVEELFNKLESLEIKTIALVTDSAAAYTAASQLYGILTQNHRIQELDELKRLYKSTLAPSFLDNSKSILSTFSTFQDTEAEIDSSENVNTNNDKYTMKL
ncbi:14626_t:CDS:2 [Cetraspora pellucida]|uniref:14626_t:CDS:1 n=1 Tax=Cetraspora pellucida TaxID=1433469 RepID=A0A9N8VDY7_9GLOM|nr:14626_t:CDS:2 [Cetraspora pellucida]